MSYGEFFDKLFDIKYVPSLEEGITPKNAKTLLLGVSLSDIFSTPIRNEDMANSSLAGALLFYDLMNESHDLSQNILSSEGSFWHGIMHRKEGDFWNANYWFNRVGEHYIFTELYEKALNTEINIKNLESEIREMGSWSMEWFNNLVKKALKTKGELESFCLKVQEYEMRLLFDYCYKNTF